MSGIFKSVKKTLKKVGKFVKKIAPYLILAAGVYFGGAYLMSMAGGANAAQSASVAQSFTKSGGVWKSFLGGLANGTASSSAAVYAEASYVSMQSGLPLSAQVVSGTSAVQALGTTQSIAAARDLGVEAGGIFNQATAAGADPGTAMQQALAGSSSMPLADGSAGNVVGGDMQQMQLTANAPGGGLIAPPASADGSAHLMEGRSNAVTAADQAGGTVGGSNVPDTAARFSSSDDYRQQIATLTEKSNIDANLRHAETMKMYELSHQKNMMGLYMQGAGVLLNAYGQYSGTKADEKEKKRKLNWKPSGKEVDVVTPSLLQNPKGIIS